MNKYFSTALGRLRLLGILEGSSLILLLFVAMPLKYLFEMPAFVAIIGAVHGVLFLLFIVAALHVHFVYKWNFFKTTWKILLACIIPFGTFYVDAKILSNMEKSK